MRMARIKVIGGSAVYHCISRIVGGQFLLGEKEKEHLRRLMWKQAEFCGVQIVTYCYMSNHIHILVRVPERPEVSDEKLVQRMEALYGKKNGKVQLLKEQ